MSDMRFTPTHRIDDDGMSVRVDRPEYNDVGDNLFTCGWCFAMVREIDTNGHTGWHRALTNQLWEAESDMTAFWITVAIAITAPLLTLLIGSPRLWPRLFGAYFRYSPAMGAETAFWTRDGAENYGRHGLGGIDPYARSLSSHVTFRPGLLLRRPKPTER